MIHIVDGIWKHQKKLIANSIEIMGIDIRAEKAFVELLKKERKVKKNEHYIFLHLPFEFIKEKWKDKKINEKGIKNRIEKYLELAKKIKNCTIVDGTKKTDEIMMDVLEAIRRKS